MARSKQPVQDIAVGVIVDAQGRYLLAKRRPKTYGQGLWEFPGGKLEPSETPYQALCREIEEELGVVPTKTQFLIRCSHNPTGWVIRLHIWLIYGWEGKIYGKEGQKVTWCLDETLEDYPLLPGNRIILNAIRMPMSYGFTPAIQAYGRHEWFERLERAVTDLPMLRLRLPELDDSAYEQVAKQTIEYAQKQDTKIILDRDPAMVERLGADGLHWPQAKASQIHKRPIGLDYWFGVSVHNQQELAHALEIGADYGVLSPVHETPSHPDRTPLGWERWQDLRSDYGLPVYALGGLTTSEAFTARSYNAQGVAGIRGFWPRDFD